MRARQRAAKFTTAEEIRRQGLYPYFRVIDSDQDAEVLIDGHRMLMFGSGNYLGLANLPLVKAAAIGAVTRYGTSFTGSRFLNGTHRIHLELEEELADFLDREAALLFESGYHASLALISSLAARDEAVMLEKSCHASLVDGSRLAVGRTQRFDRANGGELQRLLTGLNGGNALVIVEGVDPVEGEIVQLPEIVKLAESFSCDLVVSETDALGVLGLKGEGTPSHFNITNKVDIVVGSFAKALASSGGFIAGERTVIDYIRHHARPFIFSSSMTPAATGATHAALKLIRKEPERLSKLWENTERLWDNLKQCGIGIGKSKTPIVSILVGEDMTAFRACQMLHARGIFVNPLVSPSVPPGEARIQLAVMATHTRQQIDKACEHVNAVMKELWRRK